MTTPATIDSAARELLAAWDEGRCLPLPSWRAGGLTLEQAFAVGEQVVELPAVGRKLGTQIEHRLEGPLHLADALPDRQAGDRSLRLQPAPGAQVIGVRMGFEYPAQIEFLRLDEIDQLRCRVDTGAPRLGVEVEARIDDRCG